MSKGHSICTKFSHYVTILKYYGPLIDSVIIFRMLWRDSKASIDKNWNALKNWPIHDKSLWKYAKVNMQSEMLLNFVKSDIHTFFLFRIELKCKEHSLNLLKAMLYIKKNDLKVIRFVELSWNFTKDSFCVESYNSIMRI